MEKITRNLTLIVSRINRQHIQLIIMLVTLGLLVIGSGAPTGGGSGIGGNGG